LRILFGLSPLLVALLWLAGVVRFRHYELTSREWAVVVAVGFMLHVLYLRAVPQRRLPPLPAGTSPPLLAALAAAIIGLLAAVIGGVLEWAIEPSRPSEVSWLLRTTWHAACSFGGAYCAFLRPLLAAPRAPAKRD
jgi:hypothetical protein